MPLGACRPDQLEAASHGVDGDVGPAVVAEVAHHEAAPDGAGQAAGADEPAAVHELTRQALCGPVFEHLDRLGVLRQVRHGDGAVGQDEVGIRVAVEVDPCSSPAGEGTTEGGGEARPDVPERRPGGDGRPAEVDGVPLAPRVGHEQVGEAVTREVGRGHSHPGVRIGDARVRRALVEAEAEPGGVGLRPSRPRDVLVDAVRVAVVRDEEVGAAVAVEVRKHSPQAVIEACRL